MVRRAVHRPAGRSVAVTLVVSLMFVIVGAALAILPSLPTMAVLATLVLLSLALVHPEYAILGALLVRGYADQLTHLVGPTPGFERGLNIASFIALFLIVLGFGLVLRRRLEPLRQPLVRPMLAMIFVGGLSLVRSWDRATTLVEILRLLSYLAVYVIVAEVIRSRHQVKRLIVVLVLVALVSLGVSLHQVTLGIERQLPGSSYYRWGGAFDSAVTFGTFLLMPLMILLALQRHALGRARVVLSLLLLLLGTALYLTLARAAWVGAVFGISIMSLFRNRRRLLIVLVGVLIVAACLPGVGVRVEDLLENPEGSTIRQRLLIWQAALDIFKQQPLLGAGMGVGGHSAAASVRPVSGRVQAAHNDYIRVLADTGVLGFTIFLWLNFAMGYQAFRVYGELKEPVFRSLAQGYLAIWAAYLVIALTSNVLTHSVIQYYFFALAGLIQALPRACTPADQRLQPRPTAGVLYHD